MTVEMPGAAIASAPAKHASAPQARRPMRSDSGEHASRPANPATPVKIVKNAACAGFSLSTSINSAGDHSATPWPVVR